MAFTEGSDAATAAPRALRRETLSQQVTQGLLGLIADHGLRPGDALDSEAALATEFGVSKPVIREAVRALQAVGILEVANGRRAVVRTITSEPLLNFFQWVIYAHDDAEVEMLELRRGLETQSAVLAAQRATDDEIDSMREIIEQMSDHLEEADTFVELDAQFHLAIAAASHNTLLRHLVESIRNPIQQTIRDGLRRKWTPEGRQRTFQIHADIFAALEKRDGVAAQQVMAEHFDRAIPPLLRLMHSKHDSSIKS